MSSKIVLSGLSPMLEGLRWESENQLRIGRQSSLDIVLQDPSLSKVHAEVFVSGQGWMVRDLGGERGTLLNGIPIGPRARKLSLEDVLQCGNLVWKISQLEEEKPAPLPIRKGPTDIKTSGPLVRIQASSQKSWEQGLTDLDQPDPSLPQGRHFLTLLRGGYLLTRLHNLRELLDSFLEDALAVFDAQRASIVLLDERNGQLILRANTNRKGKKNHKSRCFSATLAQRCITQNLSLLCQDMHEEGSQSIQSGDMASIICAYLRSPRKKLGVLHLDRGPFQEPFAQENLALADAVAASVSVAIESALNIDRQLNLSGQESLGLARLLLRLHAPAQARHGERVCILATRLGEQLHFSRDELHFLSLGALLHDIGLSRLPGETGPESEEREHVQKGAALLETIPELKSILPIVLYHHERWNGSGYPESLVAETIPILAQVVAVADAIDTAMTAPRPGESPYLPKVLADIQARAGIDFDPQVTQDLPKVLEPFDARFFTSPTE